jgi:hypothetical protein
MTAHSNSRLIVLINRAPVLTLWAAVVAEHLGYEHKAALTLGKTVAGLNAQSKGRHLGIYRPAEQALGDSKKKRKPGEEMRIELLGRSVPAVNTAQGIRALDKDRLVDPAGVERYLNNKFGQSLGDVEKAMSALAASFKPQELAENAFGLYEHFRPSIPEGVRGWGAKGEMKLETIRALAR